MKKQKFAKPFFFKNLSHKEMVDLLNKDMPITLKYNESLVNRVHAKYPMLEKAEIALVIKAIFQSFRDFMVLGKVLNLNKLFFDCKLFFFKHKKQTSTHSSVKIHITTPPPLRKS